jgi:hypothetical protein
VQHGKALIMDDRQILGTIDALHDAQERQELRAQFQREGRTAAFRDALVAALGRQAQRTNREEIVMRPARWMAGKAGGIVGRVVRRLERESEQADQEKKQ